MSDVNGKVVAKAVKDALAKRSPPRQSVELLAPMFKIDTTPFAEAIASLTTELKEAATRQADAPPSTVQVDVAPIAAAMQQVAELMRLFGTQLEKQNELFMRLLVKLTPAAVEPVAAIPRPPRKLRIVHGDDESTVTEE